MQYHVTRQFQTDDLGRNKPISGLRPVSVKNHYKWFYYFNCTDVWTVDGWLITAVQDGGEFHHMRKGKQVIVACLQDDTILYYKPNAKTKLAPI